MRSDEVPKATGPVLFVIGVAGALFGFSVLSVYVNQSIESRVFVGLAEFQLWRLLIAAQTAVFAAASFPIWRRSNAAIKALGNHQKRLGLSGLIAVSFVLYFLPVFSTYFVPALAAIKWPMTCHRLRMAIVVVIGAIPMLGAIRGLFAAMYGYRLSEDDPKHFVKFRETASSFVSLLGVMIALATLATGALRSTYNAYIDKLGTETPELDTGLVLVYGLYYTILIGLVYFPVRAVGFESGQVVRDRLIADLRSEYSDLAEDLSRRDRVGRLLHLDSGPSYDLQASLGVLSPLIAALVSALLSP